MYEYINGIVTIVDTSYIVLENNGIGYQVYVGNPYYFKVNNEYKVFIYQHVREDENALYGFRNKEEKDTFLKLIEVKGLGCKMALPLLASGDIDTLWNAIDNENILYLKKFPKIGDKVARQIILDLKGKIAKSNDGNDKSYTELIEVLQGLGYKQPDIKRVINNVDANLTIEQQIKEALKLLSK